MSTPIVLARKLARWFGPVVAVTEVDLTIPEGVIGLLGPNGAGKSTLLKLLMGQLKPSSGDVLVFGRNPMRDHRIFHDVGFCAEDDALFEDLTPREMVGFLARLRGFSRDESKRRTVRALERCGILESADRVCRALSKGQRQRVRIAAALLHEPTLLVLDEPMTGLDPVGRRDVMDLIRSFASQGRTVLFSSHILHEVEAVSSYVVVLDKGMVLAEGSLDHIRECLSDYAFTLEIAGTNLRELAAHLLALPHVISVELADAELLRVGTSSSRALLQALPAIVLERGVDVRSIESPNESLEAIFSRLVR